MKKKQEVLKKILRAKKITGFFRILKYFRVKKIIKY